MRYWLNRGARAEGPYEEGQLAQWIAAGALRPPANVCAEGSQTWQPIESVLGAARGAHDAGVPAHHAQGYPLPPKQRTSYFALIVGLLLLLPALGIGVTVIRDRIRAGERNDRAFNAYLDARLRGDELRSARARDQLDRGSDPTATTFVCVIASVFGLGALLLFRSFVKHRRWIRHHNAQVDRVTAERLAHGLDPETGRPPTYAPGAHPG